MFFLIRVLPEVNVDPELWLSGGFALALAVFLLHRFLRSLLDFRATLAAVILLLLLFGAATAMTGIVHQLGWLMREDEIIVNESITRSEDVYLAVEARNLWTQARLHQLEHGQFPTRLEKSWFHPRGAVPEPWIYLGPLLDGEPDESRPRLLILSPRPTPNGRWIYVTDTGRSNGVRTLEEIGNHVSLSPEIQERLHLRAIPHSRELRPAVRD